MQTAERGFEQTAADDGVAFDRPDRSPSYGARVRLGLAVAGLAALVGWGVLSHVQTGSSVDARGASEAQEAPVLQGHGKWIGYTSP